MAGGSLWSKTRLLHPFEAGSSDTRSNMSVTLTRRHCRAPPTFLLRFHPPPPPKIHPHPTTKVCRGAEMQHELFLLFMSVWLVFFASLPIKYLNLRESERRAYPSGRAQGPSAVCGWRKTGRRSPGCCKQTPTVAVIIRTGTRNTVFSCSVSSQTVSGASFPPPHTHTPGSEVGLASQLLN